MLVGASYTLFKMRKNLTSSLGRALGEVRHGSPPLETMARTERYMSAKTVFGLIAIVFALMIVLYIYVSGLVMAGIVAAIVMLIVGFFFATVSGNLVGVIGSSNNPISGLTLSTLIIAAVLMVALGVGGPGGVAVVLAVAAVVCVSSAVAGELLQDFKAGYLLGGTPRSIQIVELIAVVVASAVMYYPLYVLQVANVKSGGTGFGDPKLAAPQAGLMAALAQGIVGGDMAWPLVIAGMMFGVSLIMFKVRSPMLVAVGMYLPFPTTFAIFVGGILRWMTDKLSLRAGHNEIATHSRRERRHPSGQRLDRWRGFDRATLRMVQVQGRADLFPRRVQFSMRTSILRGPFVPRGVCGDAGAGVRDGSPADRQGWASRGSRAARGHDVEGGLLK